MKILSIAYYTIKENIRNKVLYIVLLFGIVMLAASLLFGVLGGEQDKRLVLDLGLGLIELFGLILVVFGSVTLILEELDSKTIYLVLTRPVKRYEYILGRFFGHILSVAICLFIMMVIHLFILLFKGWTVDIRYFLSVFFILFKTFLIGSVAVFWSLFSTSTATAVSYTIFFWILGHLGEELKFMGAKVGNVFLKFILKIFFYVIPNFQYFNLKDKLELTEFRASFELAEFFSTGIIFNSIIYGVIYISFCLLLSSWLFSRKEF